MWTTATTTIEEDHIYQYRILENKQYLTFENFLRELKEKREFRTFFNNLLANTPFKAFFWECPAVNNVQLDQDFEFVVINSPILARIQEDGSPFHTLFKKEKQAISFENLGKDAQLVAPTPQSSDCYAHLADFVRKAPADQQDAFWRLVGNTCESQLSQRNHWWSTSGLGVYWLHLRIDTFPKYYQYRPYCEGAW
ncbi:MAG: hypothetical protein AAGG68_16260 [Bacteroidota bacterium]